MPTYLPDRSCQHHDVVLFMCCLRGRLDASNESTRGLTLLVSVSEVVSILHINIRFRAAGPHATK